MNTATLYRCLLVCLLALGGFGCEGDGTPTERKPQSADKPAEAKKKALIGRNVFFETEGKQRRVLISSEVCLREGPLELLLTIREKKEHEAVLAADVDARDVHKALLAAGAEAGSPVQYEPKYLPAHGAKIKVTLLYEDKGKLVSVPAQQWVRNARTKKPLEADWVFAGSRFVKNPLDDDKPHYLANDGDVICVSNFETALLDLPINSSKDDVDLAFEIDTEKVPPKETKVVVVLEPIAGTEKKK